MAAYTLITSVTVGVAGAADIEFTSIPQTYTDLLILMSLRQGGSQTHGFTFNNNTTGGNYYGKRVYGQGQAGYGSDEYNGANSFNPIGVAGSSQTSNTFGILQIYIPNYTSNSTFKSMTAFGASENNGNSDAIVVHSSARWQRNDAITSFKITPNTSYVQYSTAYLYGISNA